MKSILLLLLGSVALCAQTATSYPAQSLFTPWQVIAASTPTSASTVTNTDSVVDRVNLNFPAAGTCTITNAAGDAIISITLTAAGWVPPQDLGGVYFVGGVKWSCTVSGVVGWMRGRYKGL